MENNKITDLNIPELDIFTKCNEAQLLHYFEPDQGLFIAESPVIIERAIKAGYQPYCWLVEEGAMEENQALIEQGNSMNCAPVYTGEQEILKKLTGFNVTRGILCAMRRQEKKKLSDILKNAKKIAVLEDVMNPTNMGAIFRSAAALYADAVIITRKSTDPLYRRSARVSMGTVFQIPWTIVDNDWLYEVKSGGFKIISMALCDNSYNLDAPELKDNDKRAIVFGTESTGISEQVLKASDYIVKIPMANGVDSLNVAAASAVAFWELCR